MTFEQIIFDLGYASGSAILNGEPTVADSLLAVARVLTVMELEVRDQLNSMADEKSLAEDVDGAG